MTRRFDAVIFGASGFTGQFVVQEFAKQNKKSLRWAVAGRNKDKLQNVLNEATKVLGDDYSGVDILIADVKDEESLMSMCSQARLVLNCVGPYRFFGEPVVKACVENDCHHIDVSGEPEFLETMQYKYDEKARESKIFVIGTCGFDSIPADMGIIYAQKHFPGQLCHVESFLTVSAGDKGMSGHFGTYQSIIYGIASEREGNLKKLRKQLFTTPMPRVGPKLKIRMRRQRLRWFGHLERREENAEIRRTLHMNVDGVRKRGRPRKRWMDAVNSDMKAMGITRDMARDRDVWRRNVHGPVNPPGGD